MVDAPGGFRLVPGASGVARLADLDEPGREALLHSLDKLDELSDVVIFDCGAGIGAGVFTMIDAADLTLVITTPEPTAVTDAYALLKCAVSRARRADADRTGPMALVVNQARRWEEADEVHRRIVGVSRRFLDIDLPMAGWISSDRAVPDSVRARRPLLLHRPTSDAAQAVSDLSGSVCELLNLAVRDHSRGGGLAARFMRLFRPAQSA